MAAPPVGGVGRGTGGGTSVARTGAVGLKLARTCKARSIGGRRSTRAMPPVAGPAGKLKTEIRGKNVRCVKNEQAFMSICRALLPIR